MHRQAGRGPLKPVFITSEVYRRPAYGPNHPLGISRVETVVDLCQALGWLDDGLLESPTAGPAQLQRFHTADYIAALREADRSRLMASDDRRRFNIGTLENPVFAGVYERAATAVGGSILAAERALEGRIAYHPAGGTHHARPGGASGFCYFNDPVFAVLTLLDHGLTRVAYVDLDAHHGDGVEDAFAADCRVFTISIHEAGRWPGTGLVDDRREGRARNLPVPPALNDTELDFLIEEAVQPLLMRIEPQVVVITAGADPLAGDPLSSMAVSNRGLWAAVASVAVTAPAAVVLGGGGYNPWTLARFWGGLWGVISGKTLPECLPKSARTILQGLTCDLIDDDDFDPDWLTTLCDRWNAGPVRAEVVALKDAVLAP